jgi:hypothetical protein
VERFRLDHDSTGLDHTARRRTGLALHALALLAAWSYLPATLASARYALAGGAGRGVVERLALLGSAALLATCCAAWLELRRPPVGTTAALLRRAGVALVLAWLWIVFPQQDWIVPRPLPDLGAAVGALVFSSWSLCARVAPERLRRPRAAADLALTSAALALLVLELGLQAASRTSDHALLTRPHAQEADRMLRALRLPPGSRYLGGRANTHGYVDEEFRVERRKPRRVVSIGDSFSTGVVPHAFHYTTVAEELLGDTEILNFGVPGIGPDQYRQLLSSEGLAFAPDQFLVVLFAGNDLEGFEPLPESEDPAWLQRRNTMLFLVARRLGALLRERARAGIGADEVDRRLGKDLADGLEAREQVLALPHLADPLLESPTYSPEHFLALEVKRARLLGSPSQGPYERLLSQLEALVESAGEVRIAFAILPDEFQVDDELWAQVTAAADQTSLERERFQRVVLEWGRARGVPVLDVLPHLRAQPPWSDGRPHLYHLRDTHFNRRGNRAAGEALARFLAEILPSAPDASGR